MEQVDMLVCDGGSDAESTEASKAPAALPVADQTGAASSSSTVPVAEANAPVPPPAKRRRKQPVVISPPAPGPAYETFAANFERLRLKDKAELLMTHVSDVDFKKICEELNRWPVVEKGQ